jgi:spermidine/putrescine transport system substrate-binding protein
LASNGDLPEYNPDGPAISPLNQRTLTRGGFLKGAGALTAAALPFGLSASRAAAGWLRDADAIKLAKGGTLNYYAWSVYTAPPSIKPFEAATGTKVNISTFISTDAFYAKLSLGNGGGFDLATAPHLLVPELVSHNLLEKLDHSKIDWSQFDPRLLNTKYDPHNVYTVPKAYGTTGVLYDPKKVGAQVETWNDFLTLGAKPHISGKVIMTNSAYFVIGIGLMASGHDLNTTNTAAIEAAGARIKAFAPHVQAFNGYNLDPFINGSAIIGVTDNGDARLAIEQNSALKFVVPKPQSEIWFDTYAIPAGAKNIAQAYSFANFTLEPAQQVVTTKQSGIAGPLPNLVKHLPKNTKYTDLIFIPSNVLSRLTPYIQTPKTQGLLTQLFTEIQAAT